MILCGALFCLSLSGQIKKLSTDRYDTLYRKGFLVENKNRDVTMRPIIKMEIMVTKEAPCSTVYRWEGKKKEGDGWYSYSSPSDTSMKSPCGSNGFSMGYMSEYKGDSVVDYNCASYEYSTYKTEYFIPNKKKKNNKGEKHELNEGELYGEMGDWEQHSLIIICG